MTILVGKYNQQVLKDKNKTSLLKLSVEPWISGYKPTSILGLQAWGWLFLE